MVSGAEITVSSNRLNQTLIPKPRKSDHFENPGPTARAPVCPHTLVQEPVTVAARRCCCLRSTARPLTSVSRCLQGGRGTRGGRRMAPVVTGGPRSHLGWILLLQLGILLHGVVKQVIFSLSSDPGFSWMTLPAGEGWGGGCWSTAPSWTCSCNPTSVWPRYSGRTCRPSAPLSSADSSQLINSWARLPRGPSVPVWVTRTPPARPSSFQPLQSCLFWAFQEMHSCDLHALCLAPSQARVSEAGSPVLSVAG